RHAEAVAAFDQALAADPANIVAWNNRGLALEALGRDAEAADAYRRAIAIDPARATAWAGLADLPGQLFDDEEIAALRTARQTSNPVARERAALDLALGRALEQRGEYKEAFSAIAAANATRRTLRPAWNRTAFSQHVDALMRAFERLPAATADPTLGERTIFLVGLAHAGAAPTERVLAAHARVALVGESFDLAEVIRAQSARSGKAFPEWLGEATPDDWERLGKAYLERLGEQDEQDQPLFRVDATISNWPLLGAALTMLPAARVIDCRSEALSACWGCHAGVFTPASAVWACALDDLGAYWQDYDRLMLFWRARYGSRIHTAHFEELVVDPRRAARSLLAGCGLPADPACVRVAAETRVPARGSLDGYGDRLDSLRRSLGLK
ncbi:MAG: sulfotransferase, partial [Rhodanobacteraceae bacterium]